MLVAVTKHGQINSLKRKGNLGLEEPCGSQPSVSYDNCIYLKKKNEDCMCL